MRTNSTITLYLLLFVFSSAISATAGDLELTVTDSATSKPIPVRVHLQDQRGRSITPRGQVGWRDHFVMEGRNILRVGNGNYQFEMERGPEYLTRYGHFEMNRGAADNHAVEMRRFVEMKKHGWYAGDLLLDRRAHDMELLMLAEDLYMAPVLSWSNKKTGKLENEAPIKFEEERYYDLRTGRDRRAGGTLLYYGLKKPLPLDTASAEYPSPLHFAQQARRQNAAVHIAAGDLTSWDLPVWVAHGVLDSVVLLNEHQQRAGVIDNEADGNPRDRTFYPGTSGHGRYVHDIYYHLLNCGFRMPPSAGSGSGEVANPLGYNRVYVHCGDELLTYERWFDQLRAGKVMITNGPLLLPLANHHLPGHVFALEEGEELEVEIALQLFLRDEVDYLEVVKNGSVVHEVRLADLAKNRGKLPPLSFTESGWFLVRAVTNHAASYRLATTGPYYVEAGYQRRISKASAQYFLDWVYERARQLKLDDADQQLEVLREHKVARDFFQAMVEKANAE
jgi:hypothetical protein